MRVNVNEPATNIPKSNERTDRNDTEDLTGTAICLLMETHFETLHRYFFSLARFTTKK